MNGNNTGDDDHEGPGWSTDLGRRSAQRGDQKASNDGAVNAGLWRESRRDRKGHRQRQRDQAYGDSSQ